MKLKNKKERIIKYGKEDFDREEALLRNRLREIDRTEKYGKEIPRVHKISKKHFLPEVSREKKKYLFDTLQERKKILSSR